MKDYSFGDHHHLLVLEKGEDILRSITAFVREKEIKGAFLQGIGAVDFARLGQYDYELKDYRVVELRGALEVTSLIGNIALRDDKPFTHAHITMTTQEGQAFGGHLLDGTTCSLTMEIEIRDTGETLERKQDPRFKLATLY